MGEAVLIEVERRLEQVAVMGRPRGPLVEGLAVPCQVQELEAYPQVANFWDHWPWEAFPQEEGLQEPGQVMRGGPSTA